jgi:LuxR family maltose regulon positive regulatory protein
VSKITRPILAGVFPRKRLFGLLDRMRRQPVIWVSGPAGCGKTTLVSSYIDARNLPCLWYQIDEGDADPATFFYYLGQAAKRASPRKRKPLPLLTPEYLQGIPTFTKRYFENLYDRLKARANVVFDNYQEIPNISPLHEIILNGLSTIPEGINVILISRSETPPALIQLRANNLMGVLGWDELRLTQEESSAIIRLRSKQKVPKETIGHLHNTVDGWAAGLVLMLESIKRGIEPHKLGKLTSEEIIDYFGTVLFDKTDEEIQDFLLKTAFLPRMTARTAEELTDISHAGRILSTLSRNNYFTEKHSLGEAVYQYHPLFREFLLSRAKRTFPKENLASLCSRAAALLEEAGQTEDAVSLLRDVSNWDGLVRLIAKHAPHIIDQGRYHPLEAWLNSVPIEILEGNPWLLYWAGTCRLLFNPSMSQKYFERAFEKFKRKEEVPGIFLSWSGIIESIWFGQEDFKPLDRWISAFERLKDDFERFPSKEIQARVTSSMFIALTVRQPDHPEIEKWADLALASLEDHTTISSKVQALFRTALYRLFMGDFGKMIYAVNALKQLARPRDASPLALLHAKLAETIHYRVIGMHEKCLTTLFDGLEQSRKTGIHLLDKMFLVHGIASSLNANDLSTAGRLLEKLASSSNLKPWDKCFYHLLRAWENGLRGDLGQASLHSEIVGTFAKEVGAPYTLLLSLLIRARVMHELGKYKEAAEHLEEAFGVARRIKSQFYYYYAFLLEAQFAFDKGEETCGLTSLQKAFSLGRNGGYSDTQFVPSGIARLCVKALDAGIEVEFVRGLIRNRNLIPEKPPLHTENWPWPLRIYTLGGFKLEKDGNPIRFPGKTQQRPLAMLKALIAFGGKEVREDLISDSFWPEADGDVAHHSFEMTLHRLRKLINLPEAIEFRDGRLTLDPRYCWVDVQAFEHLFEETDGKREEGLDEGSVRLAQRAIGLYRGPFLAGEIEQSWMVSIRERLRRKFLKNLSWLGHHWEQTEQWERALECYEQGLEIDKLAEELYRRLMICYQRLGLKAEVLSTYKRCRKALSAHLGIELSSETKALYQKIFSENL